MPAKTTKPQTVPARIAEEHAKRKRLRVWIELDKPANDAEGERMAELANNMLHRLNEETPSMIFEWSGGAFHFGGPMGSVECSDRGQWFNLEYFGRPLA